MVNDPRGTLHRDGAAGQRLDESPKENENEMSTPAKPRGILVGVDGSPASKVAVDWAARDAALRKVPLTPVHVLSTPVVMS